MKNNLFLIIIACLTLGLAPFSPEPHIWEKIRWMANGEMPMETIYWLDFLMHGTPWFLLIGYGIWMWKAKRKGKVEQS